MSVCVTRGLHSAKKSIVRIGALRLEGGSSASSPRTVRACVGSVVESNETPSEALSATLKSTTAQVGDLSCTSVVPGPLSSSSIQTILQALHPPLPFISHFRHTRPSPDSIDDVGRCGVGIYPDWGGGPEKSLSMDAPTISEAGDSSSAARAETWLLHHIASAPLSLGALLSHSLRSPPSLPAEGVCSPTDDGMPADQQRPAHSEALEASALDMRACSDALASGLSTSISRRCGECAWRWASDYEGMAQPCAEVSARALHRFATAELRQTSSLLFCVAEKAYAANDGGASLVDPLFTLGRPPREEMKGRLPRFLPPNLPWRSVPVEVCAERTPLLRTAGTATLQLALQQAVRSIRSSTTSIQDGVNAVPEARKTGVSPDATHLVWTGLCWAEETDTQLVQMEEQLLAMLCKDGRSRRCVAGTNGINAVASMTGAGERDGSGKREKSIAWTAIASSQDSVTPSSSSLPVLLRAWLPSKWHCGAPAGEAGAPFLLPSPEKWEGGWREDLATRGHCTSGAAAASLLNYSPGRTGATSSPPCHASQTEPCVPQGAPQSPSHQAGHCGFSSSFPQNPWARLSEQWLLRLRKTWLVTGYREGRALHATAQSRISNGTNSNTSHSATLQWGIVDRNASQWPGHPNYNALTGAPLQLRKYMRDTYLLRKSAARPKPSSACATAETISSPSRILPTSPLKVLRGPHMLPIDDPLYYALLSRRVAWFPLHLHRRASSSAADDPVAPQAQWQLPDALRSTYTVPRESAHRLPQPLLASSGATSSVPGGPSAPSTPLPSSSAPLAPSAAVCVPQEEWWTGFFLHDPPDWWLRALRAHGTFSTTELRCLLSFLQEKCGLPPLPEEIRPLRLLKMATTNRLPSEEEGRAAAEPSGRGSPRQQLLPRVGILRSVSTRPVLRRGSADGRSTTTEKEFPMSARSDPSLELQWLSVGESDTVSVNAFLSLQCVCKVSLGVADADDCTTQVEPHPLRTSTPEQVGLVFVEIKAAWELLRRAASDAARGHPVTTQEKEGQETTPCWWKELNLFYSANTLTVAAPPPSAPIRAAGKEDAETEMPCGEAGACEVAAVCHPTAMALVRTLVPLLLRDPTAPPNCPHRELSFTESVAAWPLNVYDRILHDATVAAKRAADNLGCSRASTRDSFLTPGSDAEHQHRDTDDVPQCKEEDGRGTHAVSFPNAHAPSENQLACAVHVTPRAPSPCLPFGVEVCAYDEDGTRHSQDSAEGVGGGEFPRPVAQRNASRCAPSPTEGEWPDDRFCLHRDWPAVDRRVFLHQNHRLNEAILPPPPVTLPSPRRKTSSSRSGVSSGQCGEAAVAQGVASKRQRNACAVAISAILREVKLGSGVSRGAAQIVEQVEESPLRQPETALRADGEPLERRTNSSSISTATSAASQQCTVAHVVGKCSMMPNAEEDAPSSRLPAPTSMLATLRNEECARFNNRWRRWCRYLSSPTAPRSGSAAPRPPPVGCSVAAVCHVFPFLGPSPLSAYCVALPHLAGGEKAKGEVEQHRAAAVPQGDEIPANGRQIHKAPSNTAVVVSDLGLSVLHICRSEFYVNASNLLLRGNDADENSSVCSHSGVWGKDALTHVGMSLTA